MILRSLGDAHARWTRQPRLHRANPVGHSNPCGQSAHRALPVGAVGITARHRPGRLGDPDKPEEFLLARGIVAVGTTTTACPGGLKTEGERAAFVPSKAGPRNLAKLRHVHSCRGYRVLRVVAQAFPRDSLCSLAPEDVQGAREPFSARHPVTGPPSTAIARGRRTEPGRAHPQRGSSRLVVTNHCRFMGLLRSGEPRNRGRLSDVAVR